MDVENYMPDLDRIKTPFSKSPIPPDSIALESKPIVAPTKPAPVARLKQAGVGKVFVNGYVLDLSRAVEKVYKHELKIFAVKGNGDEKDMSRGPKNDVSTAIRHRVLWSVYLKMLEKDPSFFGTDTNRFFYDRGTNFYSIDKIIDRSEGEREFSFSMDELSDEAREYLGSKVIEVKARLLACEEVYLHDTSAVSENLASRERSVIQFLEIATTQMIYYQKKHWVFGNKAYNQPNESQKKEYVGGGKILVPGMEKNVRFVGDSWESAVPIAQIDSKKSAFFDDKSLVDLIYDLCRGAPIRALISDPRLKQRVARQLKDLVVRTTHLKTQRNFSIFGVTSQGADNVIISVDGENISVADYFMHKYQWRLRNPELPCIIERRVVKGKAMNSYFPIECLRVCKGQRVETKKQTPELTEQIINSCRLLPPALLEENEKQRQWGYVVSDNPYLRALQISIVDKPCGSVATQLYPPAILYGNGMKIEPSQNGGQLDWKLSGPYNAPPRQFVQPAKPPRRWVIFTFGEPVDERSEEKFKIAFIGQARKRGINMPNPSRRMVFQQTDLAVLVEEMNKMRKNGVEYVLYITKDKRDPVHDVLKLTEVKCLVVTQHVSSKTLLKAISNRGAELTLDNLVMKLNLKLGGISHALTASAAFLNANRLRVNIMDCEWFKPTRMFIGLDMSHSSAQSLYERQAGIPPSEPTVVGMAFTCGNTFSMRGEYWLQEPRKAIIQNLDIHVENALRLFREEFKSKEKSLPEHVVVYRGGVSEGEYAKVILEEAEAIRRAFRNAADGRPERIRLSIIVVQTNSNYRVFPQEKRQGNASALNVPAGTCIDTVVVHPTHTEFLLVPHKSIMGTARPIRCTVLVDDQPRLSLDELEGMTNALCYAHGIVTSPVSRPAHLYAAGDLAKRGRNNWKTANFGDDNESISSGGDRGFYCNDGDSETFFAKMSEDLAPKLKHKFWA